MRGPHLSDLSLFLFLSYSLLCIENCSKKKMQCSSSFVYFFLSFFKVLLLLLKGMRGGGGIEKKQNMHISIKLSTVPVTRTCVLANTHSAQTLEQVIINHSRAELVNTNDPNNSAASTTRSKGRETLSRVAHFASFSRIANQAMDCQCRGQDQ